MPNQRRGCSAKKGAFWIRLIWTHPEPRKKGKNTPHMGVRAHINIPIPITHTPTSKTHSLPRWSFPCKQLFSLLPARHPPDQQRPTFPYNSSQRHTEVHTCCQRAWAEGWGKTASPEHSHVLANSKTPSPKLVFNSKISQAGHSRWKGAENDCPSACAGHGSIVIRGLIPASSQFYKVFPSIIRIRQPRMSVRPWQTAHIYLQAFYSSCNKSGNSFRTAHRSTSNRKGNVNCQPRINSFSSSVACKVP